MANSSIEISITADSSQVKSALEQVKGAFASATSGINASLASIKGFADLKRQTQETAKEYAAAQAKVAELAKEINGSAATEELRRQFDTTRFASDGLRASLSLQQETLQRLKSYVANASTEYRAAGAALKALRADQDSDAAAVRRAESNYAALGANLKWIKAEYKNQQQTVRETKIAYKEAGEEVSRLATKIKSGAGGAALAKDFSKAKAAAAELKRAMESQQSELQRMRQSMAKAGVATSGLGTAQQRLRAELEQTKAKYQSMAAVANARDVLGVRRHTELKAEIAKVGTAYKTLAQSGQLSAREQAQAWVKMKDQVANIKGEMNGWAQSLAAVRVELLASGAGALVWGRSVTGAIRSAIDFESSMADVKKVVEATQPQMVQLRGEILQLARVIPTSQDGLAKIAAMGGQMGLPAEDIKEFTRVAATMGTAFNMSADEVGQAIGTMKSIFSLTIPEVAALGDNINTLGNTMATNEKNIIDVMNRIGGSVKVFGLSREGAAALSAAMLELGQSPEVASTSINALLTKLQTANVQTPKFKAALEDIGLSAEEMARMVNDKPQQAIDTLLATLAKLSRQEQAEALTNLFGAEYQDNIALLVQGMDSYKKALAEVSNQSAVLGSTEREAAERNKTSAAQLQLLKNSWNEVAINVGDVFLPTLNKAVAVLRDITAAMADYAKSHPVLTAALVTAGGAATTFFAIFAARKALMLAFGAEILQVGGFVGRLIPGLQAIGGACLASVPGALSLSTALAGVALASATFLAAYKLGEWLTMKESTDAVAEAQRELAAATKRTDEAFAEVSQSTGVTITNMKQLDQAVKDGRLHYDDLTGTWVKGSKEQQKAAQQTADASKRATGEALEAMKKKYQEYAKDIQRLNADIASHTRSLYAELRDMARSGMSDESAWRDQKKEAEEYASAAKQAAAEASSAMANGDEITAAEKWKEAIQYANDSKEAYKNLNTEVKSGETVVISSQQALNVAMDGVKKSGLLGVEIMKAQVAATKDAQDSLEMKSGFANLAKSMDEAEQQWMENWESMSDDTLKKIDKIDSALDAVANKKRTAKLVIDYEDGSRSVSTNSYRIGGLIGYRFGGLLPRIQALASGGGVRNILAGGRLAGYGGGDRRLLLGEDGEVMIRKESVKAAGIKAALAFNAGRWDIVLEELRKRMGDTIGYRLGGLVDSLPAIHLPAMAAGGQVAPATQSGLQEFGTMTLVSGGTSAQVVVNKQMARDLLRIFDQMGYRASA